MTANWQEFADAALRLPPAARERRLATVCVAANRTVAYFRDSDPVLPASRPGADIVRATAASLYEQSITEAGRIISLVGRRWKLSRDDADDQQHWADLEEARERARELGDSSLLAWVELTMADQLISTQRPRLALPIAESARRLVEEPGFSGFGPYAVAEPWWTESADEGSATTVIRYNAWAVTRLARRYTGDLDGWVEAVDRGIAVAADVSERRPSLLKSAMVARATMQRALGEQADLSEYERLRSQSFYFDESFVAQTAYNASSRGDRTAALENHMRYGEMVLRRREPDLVGLGPEELAPVFAQRAEEQRRLLNNVANASYEIALNYAESGRADASERDRETALAWLDVADAIWAGWATNGLFAVASSRASMRLPNHPDSVFDMIRVADEALRPGLRVDTIRRAAFKATRHIPQVRGQIEKMLDESWEGFQRATLLVADAWLRRQGTGLDGDRAVSHAHEALQILAARPASRLTSVTMAEMTLAAQARLRGQQAAEREAHLGAITAVGRMLLNATSSEQRLLVARDWSATIRDALRFSEQYSDPALADLVHEVVRRDGIGALLADVIGSGLAPSDATKVALDATLAGRSDISVVLEEEPPQQQKTSPGPDVEPDDDADERLFRDAGTTRLKARDDAAYQQAQRILGPLGSLIDPSTLYSADAASILAATPHASGVYLLQLLPSSLVMVGTGGAPTLHRRLSWIDDGGAHEIVDSVPLPDGLVEEPGADELLGWRDGSCVLPEPFARAFENASRDRPLRLLVVPTGLFHLQFDALELGGVFLLERTLTTVHTSLTALQHALRTVRPWDRSAGSYAVFDTNGLPATKTERAALAANFPVMSEPSSKDSLRQAFDTSTPALLAMGVHGSDDEAGWAQTKSLPGGEVLSAAEALGFNFPDLCVLASCHSRVRQHGVDHAGFPTAMFARGATTIIGSIGLLHDRSTSKILQCFYEELGKCDNAVEALRTARLTWIDEDPDVRWDAPEYWGRLVAYGGAHS